MSNPYKHAATMSDLEWQSLQAFQNADVAWSAELQRQFGRDAGDVRYISKGRGEPGSPLRELYDKRFAAMCAWENAKTLARVARNNARRTESEGC